MLLRFWGTRGSIAAPGPATTRYGGNTPCVELVTRAGQRFIFDCGTGARELGHHLQASEPKPLTATILLGHTHWDHIQGFPFFAPVFEAGNRIAVCAPQGANRTLPEVLAGQMEYTYFPVEHAIGRLHRVPRPLRGRPRSGRSAGPHAVPESPRHDAGLPDRSRRRLRAVPVRSRAVLGAAVALRRRARETGVHAAPTATAATPPSWKTPMLSFTMPSTRRKSMPPRRTGATAPKSTPPRSPRR